MRKLIQVFGELQKWLIKRKIENIHLQEPKEINPQISDRINQAILTGMKLNPQERSQSVQEWLDSLGLIKEATKPKSIWNWDKKIQFWGVVIAGIAAFAALLQGMGAIIPILPKQPPSPTATNNPLISFMLF
jgi:hypothetical protein